LNLPDVIRENATFMAYIDRACDVHTERAMHRNIQASRLRHLEMVGGQNSSEDLQAVRKEFEEADEAVREALAAINALKALIVKHSPPVRSSSWDEFEESDSLETNDT
jgi:hypothetical protein